MASIVFHPQGCSSGNSLVTLVSPGSAGTGTCFFNDGAFPNSNPAGGYEVRISPYQSCLRHFFSASESLQDLIGYNTDVRGIDSRDAGHSVGCYNSRSTRWHNLWWGDYCYRTPKWMLRSSKSWQQNLVAILQHWKRLPWIISEALLPATKHVEEGGYC